MIWHIITSNTYTVTSVIIKLKLKQVLITTEGSTMTKVSRNINVSTVIIKMLGKTTWRCTSRVYMRMWDIRVISVVTRLQGCNTWKNTWRLFIVNDIDIMGPLFISYFWSLKRWGQVHCSFFYISESEIYFSWGNYNITGETVQTNRQLGYCDWFEDEETISLFLQTWRLCGLFSYPEFIMSIFQQLDNNWVIAENYTLNWHTFSEHLQWWWSNSVQSSKDCPQCLQSGLQEDHW